jgi:hypothetical protein
MEEEKARRAAAGIGYNPRYLGTRVAASYDCPATKLWNERSQGARKG